MADVDKPFMNQAEFARHRNVVRSTITVWKKRGQLVLDADGRIDVAASDRLLNERPATYRGGSTEPAPTPDLFPTTPRAGSEKLPLADVHPDSSKWSTADALRVKETNLALLRRAEYEEKIGALVSIEEVGQQLETENAAIRERLLSIPGKIASSLVGLSISAIEAALHAEMTEALGELYEPSQHDSRRRSTRGTDQGSPRSVPPAYQA